MRTREILDRIDLAALLTELGGEPVGRGRGARWPCFAPDHVDTNPSVTMFVDRNGIERWRCWSDGNAGTAIDAVMIARNFDLPAAFDWLRSRAGDRAEPLPRHPTPGHDRTDRPLSAQLKRWVNECEHRLWQPAGAGALEWLHDRGLADHVLRANRIGYDPGHRRVPRHSGLPMGRGITVCSFDQIGEIAYVQVRNLEPDAPSKYTNPTPRHGSLPAVTFPRGGPENGPLIVTEGVFDGLAATQAGYRAAALISTSSAAGSSAERTAARIVEHAHGNTIVVALDGDPAGRNASRQLCERLLAVNPALDVRVLQLPDHHDLSSLHARKDTSCPHTPTTTHASASFSTS